MTIRLFNPEHDIALASNIERFTAPHAGRQLRSDLCFLPALWSADGDVVIVDDIDYAESMYRKLKAERKPRVEFCTLEQIPHVLQNADDASIQPWGWDDAIRFQLLNCGVPTDLLPSKETLSEIRRLSGRQVTTNVLKNVRCGIESKTCGESVYITDYELFLGWLRDNPRIVVKAPWSSSGRGVRYFLGDTNDNANANALNWVRNTIRLQGGVMVEPLYNKVKDFGMEFVRNADGSVSFLGLSLFQTQNGAYTGNILATEAVKREMLSKYISLSLLDDVVSRLESELSKLMSGVPVSSGPSALQLPPYGRGRGERPFPLHFGVDMMIVARDDADGFLLHPCVEINLRRTMGHLALALCPLDDIKRGTMAIAYESKRYHIKLKYNFM